MGKKAVSSVDAGRLMTLFVFCKLVASNLSVLGGTLYCIFRASAHSIGPCRDS